MKKMVNSHYDTGNGLNPRETAQDVSSQLWSAVSADTRIVPESVERIFSFKKNDGGSSLNKALQDAAVLVKSLVTELQYYSKDGSGLTISLVKKDNTIIVQSARRKGDTDVDQFDFEVDHSICKVDEALPQYLNCHNDDASVSDIHFVRATERILQNNKKQANNYNAPAATSVNSSSRCQKNVISNNEKVRDENVKHRKNGLINSNRASVTESNRRLRAAKSGISKINFNKEKLKNLYVQLLLERQKMQKHRNSLHYVGALKTLIPADKQEAKFDSKNYSKLTSIRSCENDIPCGKQNLETDDVKLEDNGMSAVNVNKMKACDCDYLLQNKAEQNSCQACTGRKLEQNKLLFEKDTNDQDLSEDDVNKTSASTTDKEEMLVSAFEDVVDHWLTTDQVQLDQNVYAIGKENKSRKGNDSSLLQDNLDFSMGSTYVCPLKLKMCNFQEIPQGTVKEIFNQVLQKNLLKLPERCFSVLLSKYQVLFQDNFQYDQTSMSDISNVSESLLHVEENCRSGTVHHKLQLKVDSDQQKRDGLFSKKIEQDNHAFQNKQRYVDRRSHFYHDENAVNFMKKNLQLSPKLSHVSVANLSEHFVMNASKFQEPYLAGFKREVVRRNIGRTSDIYYIPPGSNKKLRTYVDIEKWLAANLHVNGLNTSHFDFYKLPHNIGPPLEKVRMASKNIGRGAVTVRSGNKKQLETLCAVSEPERQDAVNETPKKRTLGVSVRDEHMSRDKSAHYHCRLPQILTKNESVTVTKLKQYNDTSAACNAVRNKSLGPEEIHNLLSETKPAARSILSTDDRTQGHDDRTFEGHSPQSPAAILQQFLSSDDEHRHSLISSIAELSDVRNISSSQDVDIYELEIQEEDDDEEMEDYSINSSNIDADEDDIQILSIVPTVRHE